MTFCRFRGAARRKQSFLPFAWQQLLAILLLSQVCFASEGLPSCSLAPAGARPPVVRYSGPAQLEGEERFIFRGWGIPEIMIEAEYDTSGVLKCASPLAGPSYYWPYAFKALQISGQIKTGSDGRVVVVFPDRIRNL